MTEQKTYIAVETPDSKYPCFDLNEAKKLAKYFASTLPANTEVTITVKRQGVKMTLHTNE